MLLRHGHTVVHERENGEEEEVPLLATKNAHKQQKGSTMERNDILTFEHLLSQVRRTSYQLISVSLFRFWQPVSLYQQRIRSIPEKRSLLDREVR
jgi:hypothetical protein